MKTALVFLILLGCVGIYAALSLEANLFVTYQGDAPAVLYNLESVELEPLSLELSTDSLKVAQYTAPPGIYLYDTGYRTRVYSLVPGLKIIADPEDYPDTVLPPFRADTIVNEWSNSYQFSAHGPVFGIYPEHEPNIYWLIQGMNANNRWSLLNIYYQLMVNQLPSLEDLVIEQLNQGRNDDD